MHPTWKKITTKAEADRAIQLAKQAGTHFEDLHTHAPLCGGEGFGTRDPKQVTCRFCRRIMSGKARHSVWYGTEITGAEVTL